MAAPVVNSRPVFFGFDVDTNNLLEPQLMTFPVDVNSPTIRWGDPVKQVAGGGLTRCSPTDTVSLGFAATSQVVQGLPSSIPFVNPGVDVTGRPIIHVYVADAFNMFVGESNAATSPAKLLDFMDLQYAVPALSAPTIANVGAAGGTTYNYKVTAVTSMGENIASAAGTTATGNATLSATNYNSVTFAAGQFKALSYNIYRQIGAGIYAKIGNVANPGSGNVVFNDTGQSAIDMFLPPTVDYSGWLINYGASSTNLIQITALDDRGLTSAGLPTLNPPQSGGAIGSRLRFTIAAQKSQWLQVAGS